MTKFLYEQNWEINLEFSWREQVECFDPKGIYAILTFLSLSAAYARQASISSLLKSGKSSKISSKLIPEARYSKTSITAILVPLIQGLPNLISGSNVIIFCHSMNFILKRIEMLCQVTFSYLQLSIVFFYFKIYDSPQGANP